MPSFRASFEAYAALSASLRIFRIIDRIAAWSFIVCLAFTAGRTQAQPFASPSSAAVASAPLAMVGAGLVSSGDFSLTISELEIGSSARLAGTALLTVTPTDGFSEPVSFQCSGLPAGAACSFSPATVTPAGNPVNDTLTVTYYKPAAASRHNLSPVVPAGAAACVLFCCFGLRKRRYVLSAVLAAAAIGACVGCSTGNPELKTYPITLTASSGSLHHDVMFLLTVE